MLARRYRHLPPLHPLIVSGDYTFRDATRDDLPLLFAWLRTPEVVRWWGDPEHEAELLREDIDNPQMAMRIVSYRGRPFAYTQDYDVHVWPQEHLAALPRGARAIDAFIGVPELLGRGHGARFLRLLAERSVAAGAPVVARGIDPDEDNLRARRAYANAGFRGDAVVDTEAGPAVLMLYTGASSTPAGSSATDGGTSENA